MVSRYRHIFDIQRIGHNWKSHSKTYQESKNTFTILKRSYMHEMSHYFPFRFKPGPKWIPIPVIARAVIIFIFFAFCNFKPEDRKLPVLIANDWAYWVACAISPLVFGYLTSLLMMYTPR